MNIGAFCVVIVLIISCASCFSDPLEAPSLAPIRTFLTSSPPSRSSSLPTPQPSSPPQSEAEADAANATGRERRVRKSVVSYAEPKLNTSVLFPFCFSDFADTIISF